MRSMITNPVAGLLAAAMTVCLAGCILRGKQTTANAAAPPPAPVVKPTPPPPPTALSTPQTQVQLPPPQAVDPQALAAAEPRDESPETPSTAAAPRRAVGPHAIVPARAAEQPPVQQPAAQPAPATEEVRPPIGEIVAPGEMKRLQESAAARKKEIRQLVDQARARGLTRREQDVVARIESFVRLSDQDEARGDMREADALAERALVLAKDLSGGR